MKSPHISKAIALCGTEQPDVPGRVLTAGPIQVEFDNGQLRYLKVKGIEVLRAIGFLVRDENWGTYIPKISDLKIEERSDDFSISFHAVCSRPGQEIAYDARITANATGLEFTGTALPRTDFLTARTGFVVLHPLKGVAGHPVTVEHVDGRIVNSKFPALVDPVQPFLNIRALTHEVMPGLNATVRMEGDTFEMEDHRNWTDASFKTYVRPLALPWPYTLKAGETVRQSIRVTLSGAAKNGTRSGGAKGIEVKVGAPQKQKLFPIGLGVPAEEIDHAVKQLDLVKLAGPRILQGHFDPRQEHGAAELYGYRVLAEQTGAQPVLEIVVESVDRFAEELETVASLVERSGLKLAGIAVCPVGDLKSVLPGGARPPAPKLDELYRAARSAFPGVKLGGGMFSFFTELNRKHPPAELLDFVMNTTCPIVHAADDRSVMETLEALPYQVETARTYIGKTPHRVGPSALGCRDNPHGKTFTPNPGNERVCLAKMDPRQRGLFGAAWTLGYAATFAPTGIESLTLGAPTGPLGLIYRRTDYKQPYYDGLPGPAVYPAFHVVSGLTRGAGQALVSAASSDSQKLAALAYRGKTGTTLWLANLTGQPQPVRIAGAGAEVYGTMLDEDSFEVATSDPRRFQKSWKPMKSALTLKPYGVAILSLNDR